MCFNIFVLNVFIHSLNTKYLKFDSMIYFMWKIAVMFLVTFEGSISDISEVRENRFATDHMWIVFY